MDIKVGYATTSALENIARETIITSWKSKDYATMLDYIKKYHELKNYNGGKRT